MFFKKFLIYFITFLQTVRTASQRRAWKNAAFHPRNGIHCWFLCSVFFFLSLSPFFARQAKQGWLPWRTDVDGADADDVFHQRSSSCAIASYAQLRVVWERCGGDREGCERGDRGRETGNKNGPCRHCVFGLSRSSGCYRGAWWCWLLVVVVEVVRIFVSHSNLYQSCVRNDGWHLSMSDIFVFHFSLKWQRVREQRHWKSWPWP